MGLKILMTIYHLQFLVKANMMRITRLHKGNMKKV